MTEFILHELGEDGRYTGRSQASGAYIRTVPDLLKRLEPHSRRLEVLLDGRDADGLFAVKYLSEHPEYISWVKVQIYNFGFNGSVAEYKERLLREVPGPYWRQVKLYVSLHPDYMFAQDGADKLSSDWRAYFAGCIVWVEQWEKSDLAIDSYDFAVTGISRHFDPDMRRITLASLDDCDHPAGVAAAAVGYALQMVIERVKVLHAERLIRVPGGTYAV